MLALMAAFLPFGWSALSRFFTPGGGYFHPAMRWAELLFHLGISTMIGWLVGPWKIYKAIREIRKGRAANASIRADQETVWYALRLKDDYHAPGGILAQRSHRGHAFE